jgi:L-ascorbate metabolism protein UlaG (beta-lactamase superfamily)
MATPDLSRWESSPLAACHIGHATLLLRVGGTTILTDPVFAPRVGLGLGILTAGPARLVAPAVPLEALPRVDVVLVSHAHFDHLCRPSLWKLSRRFPEASLVVPPRHDDLTRDLRFARVVAVATGDEVDIAGVRVRALPVRHFSPRMLVDGERACHAYVVESEGNRILFGGDSAEQSHWSPLGSDGGVDLACVGIGAYDPWIEGHATPEQAWRMARIDAGARRVLPMHHSVFKLSREPMDEPLRRFLEVSRDEPDRVVCPRVGDVWYAGT